MSNADTNAKLVLDAARACGERNDWRVNVYDEAQAFVHTVAQRLQDLELDPGQIEPDVMRAILGTIQESMEPWIPALVGIWDQWHDRMHTVVALAFGDR